MNTQQILQCLQKISDLRFLSFDCVGYDELPYSVTQLPAALVVNTQPAHERGEHWIALYWNRNPNTGDVQVYFLDSLGNDVDSSPEIRELVRRTAEYCHNFASSLQTQVSATCGALCVFSVYQLHIKRTDWFALATMFNYNGHYLNDVAMYRFLLQFSPRSRFPFSALSMLAPPRSPHNSKCTLKHARCIH